MFRADQGARYNIWRTSASAKGDIVFLNKEPN